MHKTNIKYFYFLAVAVAGFFIFTAGITSTDYTIVAPVISAINVSSSSPQIYNKITFTAVVDNQSQEEDNCDHKKKDMPASALGSRIVIMKGTDTVATGEYTYKTNFTYDYIFSFPGEYTVISQFTSSAQGSNVSKTSTKSLTVNVRETDIPTLQPATFTLVGFRHISPSTSVPFEVKGAQALGYSSLVIKGDNTAFLWTDVKFDAAAIKNYPALTPTYKYDVKGKWLIEKDPATGLYGFKIEYNKSVYAPFGYTFDGSVINLSYKDNNNNQFTLTFTKN